MRSHRISSLLMLAIGISACGEKKDPAQPDAREQPRGFTVQESKLAEASVGYGLSLFQQVAAGETKPNILVSPLSASMALGMTMNGAVNGTLEAMRNTLGFGTLSEAEINQSYKGLIAQLLARDSRVDFRLANSIWYTRGLAVKQPFLDLVRTNFDAQITALNFSDPTAPKTISNWAEQKTGGRIKNLIQQIDPQEVMFLVNAVYFKAPWTSPFDPNNTRAGAFTRENGSVVNVPLMSGDASHRWSRNHDVMAVELLYADSAFSMVIVTPASGNTLAPLTAKLTTTWWQNLVNSFQTSRILLTVPKFKFEFGKQLNDALKTLGMSIAFDQNRAQFDRIAEVAPERLYISRVEHKTFIDVHELGTEAAAATAVGIGVTSLPPQLQFTRPFIFAIRERSSGAILFIGKVGDPGVGN